MSKKSERSNKKNKDSVGNKGSTMSGDDSHKSKRPSKVNIHENRVIQKIQGNKK